MNFKKPKYQVIQDASSNASMNVSSMMGQLQYAQYGAIHVTIQNAIIAGIDAAIRSIVDDMYTDQEFEEDLNLRDRS